MSIEDKIEEKQAVEISNDEINEGLDLEVEDDEILESATAEDLEKENADDGAVSFADLGLDEYTLQAVKRKGFEVPSPIQVLAIPRLLNGDANVIARARTGTGKTAAFGLPLVQELREKSDFTQALILEPTRELAMQTCAEMQSFTEGGYPRTCVLYGGASYSGQIKDLKRGSEIVVGTPGRIQDHLERGTLDISKIKYFILDEGDEMLDMGFIEDIEHIFEQANPDARILLFSATMPAPILKIAAKFMGEYEIVEEEGVVDEPLLIDQKFWVLREADKIEALVRLIDMAPDFYGLVFTMTKMDADNVTRMLDLRGYEAAALHGDIMQNQREKVLERFRLKKTRILVATDVAARGIDISGLSHVVNYSLPFDGATYVHRIGRTGRAGAEGTAVTFVRPDERRKLGFLQNAIAKASKGKMVEEAVPSIHDVLETKRVRLVEDLMNQVYDKSPVEKDESRVVSGESLAGEIGEPVAGAEGNEKSGSDIANIGSDNAEYILKDADAFYTEMAEKLCEHGDAKQVLAKVLEFVYGSKLSPKHYGKINTVSGGKDKNGLSFTSDPNQTRIFVSLGKRDGMTPRDIADFFSDLLNIPGKKVDRIDMAREFSLVSLPKESAKKAIEMSQSDGRLPHMHVDVKENAGGGGGGGRRHRGGRGRGGRGERPVLDEERRSGGRKSRDGEHKRGGDEERSERRKFEGRDGRKRDDEKRNRPPRTDSKSARRPQRGEQTRNAASAYKKSKGKAERF